MAGSMAQNFRSSPSALSDVLKVYVLNQTSFVYQGNSLGISNAKARAMLIYLARAPNGSLGRSELTNLLWGDSTTVRAGNAFRQTLKTLRAGLEFIPGLLTITANHIQIDLDRLSLDVDLLIDGLKKQIVSPELVGRPFDSGRIFSGLDGLGENFDEFLSFERSRIENSLTVELERLIELPDIEPDTYRKSAMALQNVEPANELAARALMRFYWKKGEPLTASKVYYVLCEKLDELDNDAEPSKETNELLRKIKLGESEQNANGIAVLDAYLPVIAFEMSQLRDTSDHAGRLSQAFVRDLLRTMSRFREWCVIDRATSSIDADYVLECHIAPQQRLVTLLRSEVTGRIVWSDSFSLAYDTWESAQTELIGDTASAIDVQISLDRIGNASVDRSLSEPAFDLWIHARSLIDVWRPEAHAEAIRIITNVVEKAPRFAQGHAELAALKTSQHLFNSCQPPDLIMFVQAEGHALTAVELDPLDCKSRRSLGWAYAMQRKFDAAEDTFSVSLRLNRSDLVTQLSSALGFAFCGNIEKAEEGVERALYLQPNLPPFLCGYVATIGVLIGEFETAVKDCVAANGAISNLFGWEAIARQKLGDKAGAAQAASKLLRMHKESWKGPAVPGTASLVDWFRASFPVKDLETQNDLLRTLVAAIDQ